MDGDWPDHFKWQGTFAPFPSLADAGHQLSGDKIILPQSSLEDLLAARTGRSSRDSSHSYGLDPFNPQRGDSLPSPLTFHIVNRSNGREAYAGVLEFSAEPGRVGISPLLRKALQIEDVHEKPGSVNGDDIVAEPLTKQLLVQARQLPKGTYVRLRPLEAGYNADDWKALLERQLRNEYTTLTKGLTLAVNGVRGEVYRFLVDKLEPDAPAVCVVDTDMEVDIEAMDEDQARETMRRIATQAGHTGTEETSTGGELDVWRGLEGQVLPGDYVDYTLPSWNRSQALSISLSSPEGAGSDALSLFVTPKSSTQRVAPRQATHVFGTFSPGREPLRLPSSNVEMENAESLLISVHGYTPPGSSNNKGESVPIPFTIRVRMDTSEDTNTTRISTETQEHSPDDEQCSNCMQWIPKRTMMLHQNFCLRNNHCCKQCGAVFKKGSPEMQAHWHCEHDSASGDTPQSKSKHDHVFHTTHECPSCPFTTNSLPDLARHRTSVCPGKIILCRFCHLEVPQEGDPFNPSPEVLLSGMTAHELADGARTTDCHLCHKIVRLRDMDAHMKHHELDKTRRETPPVCRNINCGRTMHGVGAKGQIRYFGAADTDEARTKLGLCATCFGPLYVSMHDPQGKALLRRIERRYLSQLMTGCGRSHCANEWCKNGRANQSLEAKPSSAAGALPLVKPLMAGLGADDGSPVYFCVDEGSQRQRAVAGMLAAEGVWDLAWCVAAAEAEGGDPTKMRDWLQAWAPNKYTSNGA